MDLNISDYLVIASILSSIAISICGFVSMLFIGIVGWSAKMQLKAIFDRIIGVETNCKENTNELWKENHNVAGELKAQSTMISRIDERTKSMEKHLNKIKE